MQMRIMLVWEKHNDFSQGNELVARQHVNILTSQLHYMEHNMVKIELHEQKHFS